MNPPERAALFIDGPNFFGSAKLLGLNIDYTRLLEHFRANTRLVRAYYYTALREDDEGAPLRSLVRWLSYHQYRVVTKSAKEYFNDLGDRRLKGNMDIEIAVDALEMANHLDHIILFTGDGDFCRLIEAVQNKGVRVTVVSSTRTNPSMLSDALRRQADNFIDLDDIRNEISRRPARETLPTARTPSGAYNEVC